MEYILVGIGGILGSLTRFSLGNVISKRSRTVFPIATFFINITGALLLGVASSVGLNSKTNLLLADGFLGAYTTFSTFMYEWFNLFQSNKKYNAIVYILGSLIVGIVGFAIGYKIASLY